MKHKNILKKIVHCIFVCFVLFISYGSSCNPNFTLTPPDQELACLTATEVSFKVRYHYMYGGADKNMQIDEEDQEDRIAFRTAKVNLDKGSGFQYQYTETVTLASGSEEDIKRYVNERYDDVPPLQDDNGWLFAMTDFAEDDMPRYGLTIRDIGSQQRKPRSVVKVRKIRNEAPNLEMQTLTHELGHNADLRHSNTVHNGNHSNCCIMYDAFPGENCSAFPLYFCDGHVCCLYNKTHIPNSVCEIPLDLHTSGNEVKKNEIDVKLTLNEPEYIKGKNIFLNIHISNTGDKIDTILDLNEENLRNQILMKDKNSNDLTKNYIMESYFVKRPMLILKPGEVKKYKIELNSLFGNEFLNRNVYSINNQFSAGDYTIHLNLKDINNINPIPLIILNPPTEKELSEYNEYIRISNISDNRNNTSNKIHELEFFLKNYPDSKFYEEVFSSYINIKFSRKIGLNNSLLESILNVITKKPKSDFISEYINVAIAVNSQISNSIYTYKELKNKLRIIVTEETAKEVLEEILKKKKFLEK